MSKEAVKSAIEEAGIPAAHAEWVRGSAPKPPRAIFYIEDQNTFYADDVFFATSISWVVELTQKSSDSAVEAALEQSIQEHFGPFQKDETYNTAENCLTTFYYFKEFERG